MLDKKLWIYMDSNTEACDPCSLISFLRYVQSKTLYFPKAKTLYMTMFHVETGMGGPLDLYTSCILIFFGNHGHLSSMEAR